ncbi:unnamed protein product, partial [Iphiclides podalirius]
MVRDISVSLFSAFETIHLAVACFSLTPRAPSSTLIANSSSSSSPDVRQQKLSVATPRRLINRCIPTPRAVPSECQSPKSPTEAARCQRGADDGINYSQLTAPACLPSQGTKRMIGRHCRDLS